MPAPGVILNIGTGAGQNHFNVGIGRPSGHTDYSPTTIAGGYESSPEFIGAQSGTVVQFRCRCDGATTSSGTKYPRSELREYDQAGTGQAAWNGATGTHYMEGVSRITHLPPNKPWVVFCQIHDASSDLIRVQTEGTSTSSLKLVARNTPPGGSEITTTVQTSYTLGTDIVWRLEVIDGNGKLFIGGVLVRSFAASTSGCYFKAGAYLQSNETIDSASEYGAVELRNLTHWHTGWATPAGSGGTGSPPGTASSFKMAFGSCVNAADSAAFTGIKTLAPDYFYLAGDCWYDDGSSDHVAHWNTKFAATNYASMLSTLPNPQIVGWSDHDFAFASNGVGAGNSITTTANTAYRTKFGSSGAGVQGATLASTGIYRTWTVGRVRFILCDERSFKSANAATDNSSKTVLGATQKAWFTNLLATSTEPLIVVLGDTPWVGSTTVGDDGWKGYNTERQELGTACAASPAAVIRLSGDMHCLGYGHDQSGIDRVWQAAPLSNVTTVKESGAGFITTYPTNANEGSTAYLFGVVTFDDSGSQITATFRGYSSDGTQRLSDSLTVSAPAGGVTGGGVVFGGVGATGTHGVGGPVTPPFPTGTNAPVDGDFLLTQVHSRYGESVSTPGGWQLVASRVGTDSTFAGGTYLFSHRYQAGDIAPSYTSNSGDGGLHGVVTRWTGVHLTDPFGGVTPATAASTTNPPVAAQVTTTFTSASVVYFVGQDNDYQLTAPSGGTTLGYARVATGTDPADGSALGMAYEAIPTVAASGTCQFTSTGTGTPVRWVALTVQLRYAGAASTAPVPVGTSRQVRWSVNSTTPGPVSAAPTIRQVLSGSVLYTATTDTNTVTLGAGTQVGDVVVGIYGLDYGELEQGFGPTPGGWIPRVAAGTSAPYVRAWTTRILQAGAQTVSVTHTDQYTDSNMVVLVLAGANATDPVDVIAANAGLVAGTASAPANQVATGVTASYTDELLITAYQAGVANGDVGNYTIAPAGMTKQAEVDSAPYSTLAVYTQALAAAGATGNKTAGFVRSVTPTTQVPYAAITMAVKPAQLAAVGPIASDLALVNTMVGSKPVAGSMGADLALVNTMVGTKHVGQAITSDLSVASLPGGDKDVRSVPAGGPIGFSVWAIDDSGAYVGALPDCESITVSAVLNEAGAVQLTYPRAGLNFALLHAPVLADRDREVSIWVGGREEGALRAVLNEGSGDEVGEQAVWTFTGTLLSGRMSEAVIYPAPIQTATSTVTEPGTDAQGAPTSTTKTVLVELNPNREAYYGNATAGTVMADLMTIAHARGALGDISVGGFTALTDSNGIVWTRTVTLKLSVGTDLKQALGVLAEHGLCDWEVNSRHELRLYEPNTQGRDLTLSSPPIVLRAGKDLTDSPRSHSVREAVTALLGAGKDGLYQEQVDATALARRGRRIEAFDSQDNIADAGSLLAYMQARMPAATQGKMELSQGLTMAPGGPLPIADFRIGDWVWTDNGNGLERLRVAQWSIAQDHNGLQAGTAVLGDLTADYAAALARRLAAIEGGTVSVGTPALTPPTANSYKRPAAPTGVVASSAVYQELGPPSVTAASVSVGWLVVLTNADGTALTVSPTYRVRYRYVDAPDEAVQPWPGGVNGWQKDPGDGVDWIAAGETVGGEITLGFSGLSPGRPIEVEAATVIPLDPPGPYELDDRQRSFRRTNLQSSWSIPFPLITSVDTTPPPAPSAPIVALGLGGTARVTWDGKSVDGIDIRSAAPDISHVELHASTASNYTPDATTLRDRLFGASATAISNLLYQVTYFVRLVAVDLAGNASLPSDQVAVTAHELLEPDIFDGAVGTEKLADLAVVNAKIADLAVNNAKVADLQVGKLVSGVGTFDLLLAGRIRTGEVGARLEMDAASFRQYGVDGALRTQFLSATGEALITGLIRTGLTGKRVELSPDGTFKLFPASGTGYNEIRNNGNEMVLRGQLDTQGRSGYLRVSAAGIATQFGVPGQSVTAQLSVSQSNVDLTSPINGLRVDKRYPTADGNIRCNVLLFNDVNGNDIPGSVIQHLEWNTGACSLSAPGRNANILFSNSDSKAIKLVYNDGNFADLQCGNVYAPNVVAPSGRDVKQNIRDVPFPVLDVIRGAKAKAWQYRPADTPKSAPQDVAPLRLRYRRDGTARKTGRPGDFDHFEMDAANTAPAPEHPDRVGPIAEDILAIAPSLVHIGEGRQYGLSYMDLLGVLWQAVDQLADKVDALTDRFPDIPQLPGRKGRKP